MSNHQNERLTASYSAYGPRLLTDQLFLPCPGFCRFSGPFDRAVRFIQENQLLDATLWARFAEQFTRPSDDHDLGWRCEYWGKLMRGGTLVWSYPQDPELYRQLEAAARATLQTAGSDGRISTYSREEITFPHSVLWWIPTLHGARCVRPCKLRQDLSNCHLRHQPYELYGGNEYRQFQETCTLWRISPAGRNRAPNGYRCTQCSRFLRDAPSDNTKWKC